MPQSTSWANPNYSGSTTTSNNTNDDTSHIKRKTTFITPPKKPKKKKRDASKKNIIEGAVGVLGNTILGTVVKETVGTAAYKHNLWRRERFIRINKLENKMSTMDPDYIGSKLGREELDRVSKGDYKKSITAPRDDTPFEPDGGGAESIATKEKLATEKAKKQEEIVLTKKQKLAKARGSGHGTRSTVMTSIVGDEYEANVAQATLGGTIMRKKKKYA